MRRRLAALAALLLLLASFSVAAVTAIAAFPAGFLAVALVAGAVVASWEAAHRTGVKRALLATAGAVLLATALVVVARNDLLRSGAAAVVLFAFAVIVGRVALRSSGRLPPAPRPSHPVVVWNPRSGGGKARAVRLDEEARARGIEPIELHDGADLEALVLAAIASGADAIAAAGGDGSQAIVAAIAAEHDLPFACIPAGTRNHFALDIGVDRDDVVGALDALVSGGERRVDLGEVNGRVFVNNVSLGVYAEAVQRPEYRNDKLRVVLSSLSDIGRTDGAETGDLRSLSVRNAKLVWGRDERPLVLQVSNNSYRLRSLVGAGTRPRIDDGRLGIAVLVETLGPGGRHRISYRQWEEETFDVDADGPLPAGVDGEALVLEPPLRFAIRPGALRVRIAQHHPGVSPSADLPNGTFDAVARLLRVLARGSWHDRPATSSRSSSGSVPPPSTSPQPPRD